MSQLTTLQGEEIALISLLAEVCGGTDTSLADLDALADLESELDDRYLVTEAIQTWGDAWEAKKQRTRAFVRRDSALGLHETMARLQVLDGGRR